MAFNNFSFRAAPGLSLVTLKHKLLLPKESPAHICLGTQIVMGKTVYIPTKFHKAVLIKICDWWGFCHRLDAFQPLCPWNNIARGDLHNYSSSHNLGVTERFPLCADLGANISCSRILNYSNVYIKGVAISLSDFKSKQVNRPVFYSMHGIIASQLVHNMACYLALQLLNGSEFIDVSLVFRLPERIKPNGIKSPNLGG